MTELIKKLETASDRRKFTQIYEEYHLLLYKIAYSILYSKEDAEDAVQETFLRLFQNFYKIFSPICPETKNYLVIICKNVSLTMKEKRNSAKMQKLSDEMPYQSILTNPGQDGISYKNCSANPEQVSCENEAVALVTQAILELPDRYRDCLYMELILEQNHREIADSLNEKPETIRKRLQRGKKRLRRELKERGVAYED